MVRPTRTETGKDEAPLADHPRAVQRNPVPGRLHAAELQAPEGPAQPGHGPGQGRGDGRLPGRRRLRARRLGRHEPVHQEGRDRRGQALMKVTGQGEVFLADRAQDIHLIYLENDKVTVNGPNVLAFDAGIDWDIERVQGVSGMSGGGLYNTALQGTGWVAILSDGPPVLLNVAQAPTFADPQAAITWSSGVTTSVKANVKMKDLIGKGSGEQFQMAFGGQGWVLVQPSEGAIKAVSSGSGGSGGAGGLLGSVMGS